MNMDKKNMLERVAKTAHRAYMKEFTAGGGGNMSMWIQGQMYVSPSGGCLGDLTAGDTTIFEADDFMPSAGKPDYRGRWPSKEAGMHLACYGSRLDVLYLSYLRSLYSTTVACRRRGDRDPAAGVLAYTPGCAMRMGRIPAVSYYRLESRKLAEAVSGVICRWDSSLLANHGMVAAGKSPEVVLAVTEEVEENVHPAILLGDQGIPLDEEQMEVLF